MRVVMVMYMRNLPPQGIALSQSSTLHIAILLAVAGTLLLGIFPGPILDFARASAAGIVG
jgi:NADH:ubiquinone oxidoreductase subunit 2 (subunit N)